MGSVVWGKSDFEETSSKSSKEFEFDLGVIDATYNREELYEKVLERFMEKHQIKKELETGTAVIMSATAERKINALLSAYHKLEWSVGLVGRYDKDMEAYFVQDVVVCEQEVSGTTVELTPQGNRALAKVQGLIGWCHSHNDMNSFHSSTDLGTTATFGLGMTVNNKHEFDVKIRKDLSIGISVLVEGRVYRESEVLTEVRDWLESAKTLIKTRSSYGGCQTIYSKKSDEDESALDDIENICLWCRQKLPKSKKKRAKCEMCETELHKKCIRQISEEGALCCECFDEENPESLSAMSGFNREEAEEWRYECGYA
jgi:hypothetical protein